MTAVRCRRIAAPSPSLTLIGSGTAPGVGYQIDRNLSLDLGLTLIDGKKVDVTETMQLKPGIPQTTSTFQGTSEGDAWLAGLQLNYLF